MNTYKRILLASCCERAAFNGLRSMLVLYLIKSFSLDDTSAFQMYASFVALSYTLPYLGGILAKISGKTDVVIKLGYLCGLLGSLLLFFEVRHSLILGLVFLILATALIRSNTASLLFEFQEKLKKSGDSLYTNLFVYQNMGVIVGTFFVSVVGEAFGWSYAYVGMVFFYSVGLLLYNQAHLMEFLKTDFKSLLLLLLTAIFCYCSIIFNYINHILIFATIISIATIIFLSFHHGQKKEAFLISYLFVIQTIFSILYEQSITTLTLFIERHVDRVLNFGVEFVLPTTFFQLIDPFCSVILGTFFVWLWTRVDMPSIKKFSLGFLILSVAYFILFYARYHESFDHVSSYWPIMASFLFAAAELCTIPIGLSVVSRIGGDNMKPIMMGCWYVASGSSNVLTPLLSSMSSRASLAAEKSESLQIYSETFLYFSYIALLLFLTVLISSFFLNKNSIKNQ